MIDENSQAFGEPSRKGFDPSPVAVHQMTVGVAQLDVGQERVETVGTGRERTGPRSVPT